MKIRIFLSTKRKEEKMAKTLRWIYWEGSSIKEKTRRMFSLLHNN